MRRITLALALALAAGCATPTLVATKRDMSNYRRDGYECSRDVRVGYGGGTGVGGDARQMAARRDAERQARRIYTECMEVRGYTVREE